MKPTAWELSWQMDSMDRHSGRWKMSPILVLEALYQFILLSAQFIRNGPEEALNSQRIILRQHSVRGNKHTSLWVAGLELCIKGQWKFATRGTLRWMKHGITMCSRKMNAYVQTKTSTWMFPVLLAIAKKWNWSKCLPTGKCLSKWRHSSTMEWTFDTCNDPDESPRNSAGWK